MRATPLSFFRSPLAGSYLATGALVAAAALVHCGNSSFNSASVDGGADGSKRDATTTDGSKDEASAPDAGRPHQDGTTNPPDGTLDDASDGGAPDVTLDVVTQPDVMGTPDAIVGGDVVTTGDARVDGPTGAEGGMGSHDAGSDVSVSSACSAYATAYCAKTNECDPHALNVVFGSIESCVASHTFQCEDELKSAAANGTAAGKLHCADLIADGGTCDEFFGNTPETLCGPPLPGKVKTGRSCVYDGECVSGSCSVPAGVKCGTCVSVAAVNGHCTVQANCPSGTLCTDGKCAPYAAPDAACGTGKPCEIGYGCYGGADASTCAPLGESVNQACGGGTAAMPGCWLAAGYYCGGLDCERNIYVDAGQPCVLTDVYCAASGFCANSIGSTCTPPAGDGGACDLTNGPLCSPPQRCVAEDGGKSCRTVTAAACGDVGTAP